MPKTLSYGIAAMLAAGETPVLRVFSDVWSR